jgi:hypothetical protein
MWGCEHPGTPFSCVETMTEERTEYEGREIVIVSEDGTDGAPEVAIDGRRTAVRSEGDAYYTRYLPYRRYASLENLARDLIDNWPTVESGLDEEEEG